MSTFGLGYAGLGRAAGRLADAAQRLPVGHNAGCWSADASKAAAFATDHGVARTFASYAEMVADPAIQGVVIASANAGHVAYAEQAAAAGKHVFCEKPLGRNGDEAAHIDAVCRQANVTLGSGYHLRYHPLIQQAREAVSAGEIGTPRLIRGHFYVGAQYDRSGWRSRSDESGGGALVSTGVHVIDAFNYVLDDRAEMASMLCDALPVEEVCSAMIAYRNGAVGMFDTSRVIPNAQTANNLEIYGTRGRCILNGVLGGWVANGTGVIETDSGRRELQTDLTLNLYTEELADWIASVIEGRTPISGGDSGVAAARVMDLLYRNAVICAPGVPA